MAGVAPGAEKGEGRKYAAEHALLHIQARQSCTLPLGGAALRLPRGSSCKAARTAGALILAYRDTARQRSRARRYRPRIGCS